jgi:hypothetical protein
MVEPISPTELARALAARRKTVRGTCAICGKPFTGSQRRKYCSPTCNELAYRRRHPERLRARWRERYRRRRERAST